MITKPEQALRVLQVLLERNKLVYAFLNSELFITDVSPNFEPFLGIPSTIGKKASEVFDALIGADQVLADVLAGHLPEYRLEYINFLASDGPGYITLNIWKHTSVENDQAGFLLVVEDVTSVARIEQRSVQARNELQLLRIQLDRANTELQRQALFDALSGLPNRRFLDDELKRYVEFAHRHGTALTAMMMDIDNFKKLNDTFGHAVGDQCIRLLANTIRESMRVTDFAARYGGEEFCIFLPMAELPQAQALARRIMSSLAERNKYSPNPFTVSVGVSSASARDGTFSAEELLRLADEALYRAKREGKNRICVAGQ